MKSLFVEVKYKGKIEVTKELIDALPQKIMLCSNIQYLDFISDIKTKLEANKKEVILFQSRHGQYPGQILGCDVFKVSAKTQANPNTSFTEKEDQTKNDQTKAKLDFDAFLYIGDGLFHPTALLFRNEKPVYCYEPRDQKITIHKPTYLKRLKKQKMARLAKFIEAKNVGILITRKPGQNQSRAVKFLKEELKNKNKNVFVFITDNINFSKLQDFNFVESWINTACPRITQDFPCLSLRDLTEINFFSGKSMTF